MLFLLQAKFAITDTKIYVLIVTLSTQDNAKLLQQLKSGFKNSNDSSANIKFSKTQLTRMVQSDGLPGKCLAPLLKTCLPLMKKALCCQRQCNGSSVNNRCSY